MNQDVITITCHCACGGAAYQAQFDRAVGRKKYHLVAVAGPQSQTQDVGLASDAISRIRRIATMVQHQDDVAVPFSSLDWQGFRCRHCGTESVAYCSTCKSWVCQGASFQDRQGADYFVCRSSCGARGYMDRSDSDPLTSARRAGPPKLAAPATVLMLPGRR